MEDDSLSRALEDEQQHVDQRLVPTEIVQKRVRTDDTEETCDSSVTDALQDDRVCADRMYPTLNEVPEDEENRVALPLPRLEEGARARNVTGGNSLERREFKQQDVAAAAPKEDATASMESGSLVIASADTPKFKSEQPKKDSQEEFKEPEGVGGASNMEDSNTAAIQNAPEDITDTNSKPVHSSTACGANHVVPSCEQSLNVQSRRILHGRGGFRPTVRPTRNLDYSLVAASVDITPVPIPNNAPGAPAGVVHMVWTLWIWKQLNSDNSKRSSSFIFSLRQQFGCVLLGPLLWGLSLEPKGKGIRL